MQRTRRLLPDSQRALSWDDTPAGQAHARWRVGWERRLRILKWATVIFAVQSVVWFVLAWNGYDTAARIVFFSWFGPAGVALYSIVWSIKEAR